MDEFDFMDKLQDDVDASVSAALPFEPDVELRDETPHEEPFDPDPSTVEPDEVAAADPATLEILTEEPPFEPDISEGFDEF